MPEIELATEWTARLPGLERLWAITKGLPGVSIAVLDGPVHSALDAVHAPAGTLDDHGTHVYSIIAGTADSFIPGIAPSCTVRSFPIFGDGKSDAAQTCSQEKLAENIRHAIQEKCQIINISAAQQGDLLHLSADLNAALQEALVQDVLVIAATGNQGCACDTIPASVPGVLAVGAHDECGRPLLASNFGPWHRGQGIIAPGKGIPGFCLGGGLCRATGTSYATAVVTAVAGLLMSVDLMHGQVASGTRMRRVLLGTAIPPDEEQIEKASSHLIGRLNVAAALDRTLQELKTVAEGTVTESMPDESVQSVKWAQVAPAAVQATSASVPAIAPAGLTTAGCDCGGGAERCSCGAASKKPQLVYAIGRLGVSFISQARRDSIWRTVNGSMEGDLKPISNSALIDLFKRQPFQAQSVVWTLSRTEVPMYVIVPTGAYAAETYRWLVEEWTDADVEFASMPGVLAGQITLYDGQTVDVLVPDFRGMYSWQTKKYVKALTDERKKAKPSLTATTIATEMDRFLGKIYFSIRNRGLSPEERALNAAATNAFNFSPIIVEIGQEGMTLRDISVERSPLNRPGSEYYDVLLTFFDPNDRQGRAPLRARFTIDVSDTVPVMIGDPVTWHEY
ncbi:MAG TPA: S8 family serine peptidase [Rhizomicrobium sp.]|nr:S8 family serine peptidase [Rhizomicrobium sp.]